MSKESTHALDQAQAVHRDYCRVTAKLFCKAKELSRSELLEPFQRSRLNVIYQQLEGKLSL